MSVSDLIAEQKVGVIYSFSIFARFIAADYFQARQRKLGVDAEGTTVEKHSATAQALQDAAAAAQKAPTDTGPVISQSLAAQMEERAAKMEGLLSTGGGFRVEARNRLDLEADNNPIMMQYVQARLAQMKGDAEPTPTPEKSAPEADEAYALPPAAAAALAEAQASKAQQDTAATPLMMNIGLAEVELPDSYKARNEQVCGAGNCTARALAPPLHPFAGHKARHADAADGRGNYHRIFSVRAPLHSGAFHTTPHAFRRSGGGSLTANYSAQADEYASKSRAGLHAGDGMAADEAMVHLHAGKAGKPRK